MKGTQNSRPQGLSKSIRYFFGIGDMCFALMTAVGAYYTTFYLTNIAQLSLGTVALVTSVVSVVDSLTSWVYGGVINSMKPMKWGRYRSWLVAFTWLIPIFYVLQFIWQRFRLPDQYDSSGQIPGSLLCTLRRILCFSVW